MKKIQRVIFMMAMALTLTFGLAERAFAASGGVNAVLSQNWNWVHVEGMVRTGYGGAADSRPASGSWQRRINGNNIQVQTSSNNAAPRAIARNRAGTAHTRAAGVGGTTGIAQIGIGTGSGDPRAEWQLLHR